MTNSIFSFIVLITTISLSQSLYINFEGKREYCFYVQAAEGVNLTISYVVSGYSENLVSMKVNIFFKYYLNYQ